MQRKNLEEHIAMKDKLTLAAVGSNLLVAAELRHILYSIIGRKLPIKEAVTSEIKTAEDNTFYICAKTQGPSLSKIVPASRLFVFDLQPTTKFFLNIAQIPACENVLVFNNRIEYAQLLINQCHKLGIDKLIFEVAAYEELSPAALHEKLSEAHYIIGVEAFTGSAILQSEKYKPYLRQDVKIISGQRTASVASANRLLLALSEYYYLHYSSSLAKAANEPTTIEYISQSLQELITGLQQSVLQTVTLQIIGQGKATENKQQAVTKFHPATNLITVQKQLEELAFLKEKIFHLIQ